MHVSSTACCVTRDTSGYQSVGFWKPLALWLEPVDQTHEESLQSLRVTFIFRSILENSTCWARLGPDHVCPSQNLTEGWPQRHQEPVMVQEPVFCASQMRCQLQELYHSIDGQCASPCPHPTPWLDCPTGRPSVCSWHWKQKARKRNICHRIWYLIVPKIESKFSWWEKSELCQASLHGFYGLMLFGC